MKFGSAFFPGEGQAERRQKSRGKAAAGFTAGRRIRKTVNEFTSRLPDPQDGQWIHMSAAEPIRRGSNRMVMNDIERKIYSLICSRGGIKAKDIAAKVGVRRTDINRILYGAPFIHELCYRDARFRWHGLIGQMRPHTGLEDFCGYYASVDRFRDQPEDEWLEELRKGCKAIGRNLNDKRGLIHSFRDSRKVMLELFEDLDPLDTGSWEICFELRIKRARSIRIYADVLVITEDKVFSLEFKMKDDADPEEKKQAVKYSRYIDIIFGEAYDVIPALVLTGATERYGWEPVPGSTAELPVCSGDMLFNLFDEYLGFLTP